MTVVIGVTTSECVRPIPLFATLPTVTRISDSSVISISHTGAYCPCCVKTTSQSDAGQHLLLAQHRPKEGQTIATSPLPFEAYEHINLNDVDVTNKAIEPNVYTMEVNKLDPVYRTIKNPTSERVGQTILVLRGSFTIVEDDTYSNRKVWVDFWTCYEGAKKDLKRLMMATAVRQEDGQELTDWASGFATLSPAARFQAPLDKVQDKRDPDGAPVNRINWFNAKPI